MAGKNAPDREICQPAIVIDPVVKEPLQVLPGGFLQQPLKILRSRVLSWTISSQRGRQLSIADKVAQHPEDIRCLGAVIDDVRGMNQVFAIGFSGSARLGQRQRATRSTERLERGMTAIYLLNPKAAQELRNTLIKPDARRA